MKDANNVFFERFYLNVCFGVGNEKKNNKKTKQKQKKQI